MKTKNISRSSFSNKIGRKSIEKQRLKKYRSKDTERKEPWQMTKAEYYKSRDDFYRKGRFFHGTIKDSFSPDDIEKRAITLVPMVGAFTEKYYGGEYEKAEQEIPELLFMCGKTEIGHCANAIVNHIADFLGKEPETVTAMDIKNHGMLVMVDPSENILQSNEDDGIGYNLEGEKVDYDVPAIVEGDDYYSREEESVKDILIGRELVNFLRKYGVEYGKDILYWARNTNEEIQTKWEEYDKEHYNLVSDAVKKGLSVPKVVLKDYPEIKNMN